MLGNGNNQEIPDHEVTKSSHSNANNPSNDQKQKTKDIEIAEAESAFLDSETMRENVFVVSTKIHSGPFPSPEDLQRYLKISPDLLPVILGMATKAFDHNCKMEEKDLDAQIEGDKKQRSIQVIGLLLGFLIGITAIVAGSLVAVNGSQLAGSLIGGGGIAGLVSTFIIGQQKEKIEEKTSEEVGEDD